MSSSKNDTTSEHLTYKYQTIHFVALNFNKLPLICKKHHFGSFKLILFGSWGYHNCQVIILNSCNYINKPHGSHKVSTSFTSCKSLKFYIMITVWSIAYMFIDGKARVKKDFFSLTSKIPLKIMSSLFAMKSFNMRKFLESLWLL